MSLQKDDKEQNASLKNDEHLTMACTCMLQLFSVLCRNSASRKRVESMASYKGVQHGRRWALERVSCVFGPVHRGFNGLG